MKTIFTLLTCVFCISINAQSSNKLDTIYTNNSKMVSLFFPKPIRQGIVGRSNFVFSYNKEKEQYFGLLQGTPGAESNLLAITNDGQVYSYILKYASKLSKLNYFISSKESIGNENPSVTPIKFHGKVSTKTDRVEEDTLEIYKSGSAHVMKSSNRALKKTHSRYKITLSVKDIAYRNDALYFLLEIKNKSSIDYDVSFLRFFLTTGRGTKSKSFQKILIKPLYEYQFPETIKGNTQCEFMLVLSKFTIDNHKKIRVELDELSGERNLRLKMSGRLINSIN